jgi:hypothetical protein
LNCSDSSFRSLDGGLDHLLLIVMYWLEGHSKEISYFVPRTVMQVTDSDPAPQGRVEQVRAFVIGLYSRLQDICGCDLVRPVDVDTAAARRASCTM